MKRSLIGLQTKTFKERIDYLNGSCSCCLPLYIAKIIDFEWVGFRKFKNGVEIEISGINNNKKNPDIYVYVWNPHIVEQIRIKANKYKNSMYELRILLDKLIMKYVNDFCE